MSAFTVKRKTRETDIACTVELYGGGACQADTGIAFLDHMLSAFARFGALDLDITCRGDLDVDGHHTAEDVGIVLGQAVKGALGDCAGIMRAASFAMPMDEALAAAALDISGRGRLEYACAPMPPMIGGFDAQLLPEFFEAFARNAGITLNLRIEGRNGHHMAEAAFKACGRALRFALERDERYAGIPSTKGVI